MKKFLIALYIFLFCAQAFAGDYVQNGQNKRICYFILDNTGTPVAGQTPTIMVQRVSDDAYLDFSTNTFLTSGWVTRQSTMSYNSPDGYYFRTIDVDQGTIISGDYVCVISNDNATYRDREISSLTVDSLTNTVKIHR